MLSYYILIDQLKELYINFILYLLRIYLAGLPGDPLHRPQVGGQEAPRRGLTFGKMVSGQGALSFPGGR